MVAGAWPIRWRLGVVAVSELERYPISATKAPSIPYFGHFNFPKLLGYPSAKLFSHLGTI